MRRVAIFSNIFLLSWPLFLHSAAAMWGRDCLVRALGDDAVRHSVVQAAFGGAVGGTAIFRSFGGGNGLVSEADGVMLSVAIGPSRAILLSPPMPQVHREVLRIWPPDGGSSDSYQLRGLLSIDQPLPTGFPGLLGGIGVFADIDVDGDLDLFLAGRDGFYQPVSLLYRNDVHGISGRFLAVNDVDIGVDGVQSFPGLGDGDVHFGDLDLDGDLDIVMTGIGVPINTAFFLNNGLGYFTKVLDIHYAEPGIQSFRLVHRGTLALGDIDNDGDLDIFLAGRQDDDSLVALLYRNDGSANFTERSDVNLKESGKQDISGVWLGTSAFGDIDGDSDLDLVFSGVVGTENFLTHLYVNDGLGNFTKMVDVDANSSGVQVFIGLQDSALALEDIDSDGDIDVFLSGRDVSLVCRASLYFNDGHGSFSELQGAGLSSWYFKDCLYGGSISFADANGDGYMDALRTGERFLNLSNPFNPVDLPDNSYYALFDIGTSTGFDASADTILPVGVHKSPFATFVDYDADGDLDIFYIARPSLSSDTTASVFFHNDQREGVLLPPAPTDLLAVVEHGAVTLSWSAAPGVTYDVYVGTEDASADGNYNQTPRKTAFVGGRWHRIVNENGSLVTNRWLFRPNRSGVYYWAVQAVSASFGGSYLVAAPAPFHVGASSVAVTYSVLDSAGCFVTPNPARDEVHITFPSAVRRRIVVRTLSGLSVLETSLGMQTSARLDVAGLPSGVYLVQIIGSDGVMYHRFLKE